MTSINNGLTVSNSGVSGNSNIILSAIDGASEGGQILFTGAGAYPNHYIDAYMGSLRVVSGGSVNLSIDSTTGNTAVRGSLSVGSLTGSRLVATNAGGILVSTITAANLNSSVSGTTGTAGNLVFSANPTFTGTVQGTNLDLGGTI